MKEVEKYRKNKIKRKIYPHRISRRVKVQAEIVDHVKGDKVIAFKMKRRKGFRKKLGHRTHYTKIRIADIA